MRPERDLFANFERMRREMDELFGDVFDRSGRGRVGRHHGGFSPAVDVFYEGDPPRAVVHAELAGIDQDCSGKDAPYPKLTAQAGFAWKFDGSTTVITRLRLTGLQGGERAVVTCVKRKQGCGFKRRVFGGLHKGSRKLDKLFRKRHLRKGARVRVSITKSKTIGTTVQLKVRKGRDPVVTRRCLRPGSSRPVRC